METEVKTRASQVRTIVQDILALSVGFGVGVLYSQMDGTAPDPAAAPAEEQRAVISNAVSAATWTDGPWRFTVEGGELTCIGPDNDPGVFFVTTNGEMFALSPAAIRMADRMDAAADLDPIWRDDPEIVGRKVNVSPKILYGLALC
ncbi:MAG: hypothetical protein OXF27_04375 [Acidobacteria bacterium]|nr:hypothetical protein [Acidobacteriota bacterium]